MGKVTFAAEKLLALKGHDFSRAVKIAKYPRALAPEGFVSNPLRHI
jgi:hypothetical protein